MAIDLLAAARRGGHGAAAVELLRGWWGLDPPSGLDDTGLLDWVRSPSVRDRLPWPQDEIVGADEDVIAWENQRLWEAVLDRSSSTPSVRFVVDDGERVLDEGMPVGEFLLRTLVTSAAMDGEQRLRCGLASPMQPFLLVDSVTILRGIVVFRALFAGPGWFGYEYGGQVTIAVEGGIDEALARLRPLGDDWHVWTVGLPLPPDANPWGPWPEGTGDSWKPVG